MAQNPGTTPAKVPLNRFSTVQSTHTMPTSTHGRARLQSISEDGSGQYAVAPASSVRVEAPVTVKVRLP